MKRINMTITLIILLCINIGILIHAFYTCKSYIYDIKKEFSTYNEMLPRTLKKIDQETMQPFEATGYHADVLEDGRIKITYLKKIAPKEGSTEDYAEWRDIILPAWMFTQSVSEASLKLSFKAVNKEPTNE